MVTRYQQSENLHDLRDYIYTTLCEQNQLQVGAFQMTQRTLYRAGTPCGMYFCLNGPRNMKATAIWDSDRNQVLFYDSSGERFQKTQLIEAAQLQYAAA
jgi:hypothetical protein